MGGHLFCSCTCFCQVGVVFISLLLMSKAAVRTDMDQSEASLCSEAMQPSKAKLKTRAHLTVQRRQLLKRRGGWEGIPPHPTHLLEISRGTQEGLG